MAVGPTMALLIEDLTLQTFVIGVNSRGELGVGDKKQRKALTFVNDLKGKKLNNAAIGKSGFVIALSDQITYPEPQSQQENSKSQTIDQVLMSSEPITINRTRQ